MEELTGLSEREAERRLANNGFNELETEKPKKLWAFLFDIVKEPMIALLVISATIYYLLGEPSEGILLSASVFFIMAITIYQERKTEQSIQALRNLSSPRALVLRSGQLERIPGREVVRDDIIIVNEGDRVPADAILLEATNLLVDESLLTGESVPVTKTTSNQAHTEKKPGGDNLPYLFSGTVVVRGHGKAKVIATGKETEIGEIGKALNRVGTGKTLLQKEVAHIIKIFASISISLCIILIVYFGLFRGGWLEAILAGITMAMSALPEEFPIILTIFLAIGSWRLTQKKVLARRAAAIETLGSTSVLCVDKTGTITQNKMSISEIIYHSRKYVYHELKNKDTHELLRTAILASRTEPIEPMEMAILEAGKNHLQSFSGIYKDMELVKEYPLEKTSLCFVQAWKKQDNEYVIAAKGSPETIMHLAKLDENEKKKIVAEIDEMAKRGLRIIAVARASFSKFELPKGREHFSYEFLGLIGLADPVRPEVKGALRLCYEAGIRTIMITGDYPETAQNIARQIGLENPDEVITGTEIESYSSEKLAQKIRTINIFARVIPEQKLAIVEALKRDGEIVAMTGDGVNDAPALKAANIGLSMGQRGTDVAREASAMVLLDDNFASIVNGVKLGRRIYDNLVNAMTYTFAVHIPIIGLSLLPVLFGWPLILFPAHVVFLELIVDPSSSFVFEQEKADEDIMQRAPRKLHEPIFNRRMLLVSAGQGLISLIVCVIAFFVAQHLGFTDEKTRAFTFSTLIFSNLLLILTNLSIKSNIFSSIKRHGSSLSLIAIGALIFLSLTLYNDFFMKLFQFDSLSFYQLISALALGFVSILWFETYKFFSRSKKHSF